jgi:hypothetical protein
MPSVDVIEQSQRSSEDRLLGRMSRASAESRVMKCIDGFARKGVGKFRDRVGDVFGVASEVEKRSSSEVRTSGDVHIAIVYRQGHQDAVLGVGPCLWEVHQRSLEREKGETDRGIESGSGYGQT